MRLPSRRSCSVCRESVYCTPCIAGRGAMLSGGAVGRAWAVAAALLLARSSAEKNFEVFNIFISNIGMTDGSAVHREGEEVEVVTFPTKGAEGVEGGGRAIEGFKVGLTFMGDPERVGGGLCG